MFDWDDQELSNIIWGEEGENIVPHSDSQQGSDTRATVSVNSLPFLSASKLDVQQTDESAQLDNRSEDRDGGKFVDFGWESFDDLDRILSNDDMALWSSTKDVIGGPDKHLQLGELTSDCQHVGTKSSVIKYEKHKQKEKSASNIVRRTPPVVYPIGAANFAMADDVAIGKCAQIDGQKKSQKTSCNPWFSLGNQSQDSEISMTRYHQTNSFNGYNMMKNHHSVGPTLPRFHSREEHQPMSSGTSYVSDKTPPLKMTPQEKIEKLKRRQKMRALMAIRKQQQEFRQQETQMQFAKAGNVEIDQSVNTFMSLQQSDSDTRQMIMMDKSSLEDTLLNKLQNVIENLGIEIRLCIRDSLFRLAQSALQRQNDGDMEERPSSSKSSATTSDGETKTNPIDRAVAHLLFHTPPDL